jgi:DNA helicase-2/ATP-dependent DNA helicase PcrA
MQNYLKNLNSVQFEAVTTTEGPVLVVAGAGSGKTRVLTTRVAHIIDQGRAEPSGILAVTFTNKAAREMKERIIKLLGVDIHSLTISTFHSFCALLLRHEAPALDYPTNFTIFDEDDALSLIKTCLDELNLSRSQFTPKSLRRKISAAKNRMEDSRQFAEKASG